MKNTKKLALIIGVVVFAALVIVGGTILYTEYNNQKEIEGYLSENKPIIPEGYTPVEQKFSFPERATLPTLIKTADLIVRGKVEAIGGPYQDELGIVCHDVTIKAEEFLKNGTIEKQGANLVVKVFGGTLDKEVFFSFETPKFSQGEEVIVLLNKGENTYYVTYEAFGKFTVKSGIVEGIGDDHGLIKKPIEAFEKEIQPMITKDSQG